MEREVQQNDPAVAGRERDTMGLRISRSTRSGVWLPYSSPASGSTGFRSCFWKSRSSGGW